MPYMVTQAFADAVLCWYEAAVAAGGSAPAAWSRVMVIGMQNLLVEKATIVAAGEAVLNGEAIIFGGELLPMVSTAQAVGWTAESGMATAAGIGVGLAACAAVLLVAGGCAWVRAKNKRDMDDTRRDALHLYLNQYWPRYVKFALQVMERNPRGRPPEPFTFEEFFANRGSRTTVPARL